MKYVQANSTMVAHIQKEGYKMLCGQSFSNRPIDELPSNYRLCKSCEKKSKSIKL